MESLNRYSTDKGQTESTREDLLSYLRSRLNIIGTSVYLIQSKLADNEKDVGKYFKKINDEIESIRKLINE